MSSTPSRQGIRARSRRPAGTNIGIQAGGGVHGHPDGTHAGAKALRAAVDAVAAGQDIEVAAEQTPELAVALDEWGTETPR